MTGEVESEERLRHRFEVFLDWHLHFCFVIGIEGAAQVLLHRRELIQKLVKTISPTSIQYLSFDEATQRVSDCCGNFFFPFPFLLCL